MVRICSQTVHRGTCGMWMTPVVAVLGLTVLCLSAALWHPLCAPVDETHRGTYVAKRRIGEPVDTSMS